MSQIFGPVPSRRLGFSLGVDTIPYKTCTLDCIYCQLGRTTNKTLERKEYILADVIVDEVEKIIKEKKKKIDYITFSGSGEPTLNLKIGDMIERIKKITTIPIAVLTNGTLLYSEKLRDELKKADLVIPSLDAADDPTFKQVNRPHPSLSFEMMVSGIAKFSQEFKGKIWLEIMLVKGINDSPKHIQKISKIIKEIRVDKIQLNTPVRPPAEEFVRPLSMQNLEEIKSLLGDKCEVVAAFKRARQKAYREDVEEQIITLIKRRPVTLTDISNSLGIHRNEVIKYIESLSDRKLLQSKIYSGKRYYYPV
ncbi:radical SAM protein [Candidatus Aerophobetes bacterium]|uniref:Radical SAM protein n=1 Tax=Aerophobetes bacterium TaxID=2030807 RepID=A0A662DKN0_UNCAE|nr:MAG: radical SAM protein [Candidatus Aerophobetes bacterium]